MTSIDTDTGTSIQVPYRYRHRYRYGSTYYAYGHVWSRIGIDMVTYEYCPIWIQEGMGAHRHVCVWAGVRTGRCAMTPQKMTSWIRPKSNYKEERLSEGP